MVAGNAEEWFHADLAAQFVAVPDQVGPGWRRSSDGSFSAPPMSAPTVLTEPRAVAAVKFALLFSPEERVAIRAAAAGDDVIMDSWSAWTDPRLDVVDLSLASVESFVQRLVDVGAIAAARKELILRGVMV